MAQYATPTELAGYMQKDLDAYTANQALTLATANFCDAAETRFEATTVTWQSVLSGARELFLPYTPVTAVAAVRVNGVAVTDYTRVGNILYRAARWGSASAFPPDVAEVDLTHGYTAVTDSVKKAVLEIASGIYDSPGMRAIQSEQIDDYTVRYVPGTEVTPGEPWQVVAARYRAVVIA